MLLRRPVVPVLAATLAVLAAATPAWAGGGLAPGGSEVLSVPVPATWSTQADRLSVSVVGLEQSENTCLRPEQLAGDSCADDEGELAGQLDVGVAPGRPDGTTCVASAIYTPLDLFSASGSAFPVAGVQCLAVRIAYEDRDDNNLAQSDSVRFGLRVVAEGPDGGIGNEDVTVHSGSGSTDGTSTGAASSGARSGRGAVAGQAAGAGGQAAVGQGAGQAPGQGAQGSGGGNVIGSQTSSVAVGPDAVSVRTAAQSNSIGSVLAWAGGAFLAAVALGWFLFLWWRRRRQGSVRGVA